MTKFVVQKTELYYLCLTQCSYKEKYIVLVRLLELGIWDAFRSSSIEKSWILFFSYVHLCSDNLNFSTKRLKIHIDIIYYTTENLKFIFELFLIFHDTFFIILFCIIFYSIKYQHNKPLMFWKTFGIRTFPFYSRIQTIMFFGSN